MSYVRYLLRRAAFAVLGVYVIVTLAFGLINLTVWQRLKNRVALAEWQRRPPSEIEAMREGYLQARNLETPIYERYVEWLVDVTTLQWGYSFSYRQSVIAVIDGRVPTTLEYVIPGVVLAIGLGVAFGVFTAFAKDSRFDWSTRLLAYYFLGIPAFMLVLYYQVLSGLDIVSVAGVSLSMPALSTPHLASLAVAAGLFAGMLRFSRTAALEQSGRAFVKMLRAKGASRWRLARHVVRNAAAPILSLSLSETIAVLMLDMYVIEEVLLIDGLASASLRAARESDVALVIWTTLVIVVIGLAGNFLQDVFAGYLDPRVRAS